MKDNLEIRRAKLSDVMSIEKCVKQSYGHYIKRIGKPPGPMLDDYLDVVRHQTVFVAVLVEVVGVMVLIRTETGILLDNVAVRPDYQGKGLGKRLIMLAETEAIDLGFEKLDLYTHESMIENIAIYKAFGYTETGRRNERGYSRVYLQKNLSGKHRDDVL